MPANYDLPENGVVKRVRYFDGLFLKDQDFIDDQKYHIDRQRRPNQLLRVAGICEGLTVLVENNQVKVTPGSALDNHGRLIVLSETRSIDLKGQAGEVDIYISYQEEASDITQATNDKSSAGASAAANTKGAKGATRWWENPQIEAILKTGKPTGEDTIWLGRVNVSDTTVQGNPNLEFRQYSGVYLPSSASPKNGPTLRSGGNVNPTLAVLTGDLNVTGNVGLGTNTPAAKLAINGGLHVGGDSDPGDNNLLVDGNSTISGALSFGSTTRQMINLWGSSNYGIGVQNSTQYFRTDKNFAWYKGGSHINDELGAGTSGTVQMVIKDGNVGIGTTSPAAKLAINGGLHVGGDSDPGDNNLLVDGNSTISGALSFGSTTRQMINLWGSSNYGIGVQNGTQYFRTDKNFAWYKGGSHINDELSAGTSGTVQMVIKDGTVGIGTVSPAELLQIADFSTNSDNYLKISTAGGNRFRAGIKFRVFNDQLGFTIENDERAGSNGLNILRHSNDATGTTALFIDKSTGNVGISTTSPGSKLSVSATSEHVQLRRESTETTGGVKLFLELYQDDTRPTPTVSEVYPSIRFHHNNRFWYRIEARPNGFHFKDGNLASDAYSNITVGTVKTRLEIIQCGGRTDWTNRDHPVAVYFRGKLTGEPPGTMMMAICDLTNWERIVWQGYVDHNRAIWVNHLNWPNANANIVGP